MTKRNGECEEQSGDKCKGKCKGEYGGLRLGKRCFLFIITLMLSIVATGCAGEEMESQEAQKSEQQDVAMEETSNTDIVVVTLVDSVGGMHLVEGIAVTMDDDTAIITIQDQKQNEMIIQGKSSHNPDGQLQVTDLIVISGDILVDDQGNEISVNECEIKEVVDNNQGEIATDLSVDEETKVAIESGKNEEESSNQLVQNSDQSSDTVQSGELDDENDNTDSLNQETDVNVSPESSDPSSEDDVLEEQNDSDISESSAAPITEQTEAIVEPETEATEQSTEEVTERYIVSESYGYSPNLFDSTFMRYYNDEITREEALAIIYAMTGKYTCTYSDGTVEVGTNHISEADMGYFNMEGKTPEDLFAIVGYGYHANGASTAYNKTIGDISYIYWAYIRMEKD